MSDAGTKRMIDAYMERASAPLFLSGFFQSPPENFHRSKEVEIDIQREDEDIAIVIQDLTTGPRMNESNKYTNKKFLPPVLNEAGAINAFEMMERRPNQNPFQDPDFAVNAVLESFSIFRKLENKVRRTVELQASQVLQTGVVTLVNEAGAELYKLDYQANPLHFPNAGVTWGAGGADPYADVASLAELLRRNGKKNPHRLIFGMTAFQEFISDTKVKERLDNRAMAIGQVAPVARGGGATFQGWIWIGHYKFEMWTYDGFYKHPQTGVLTPYIAADKVIMTSEGARLDLTFGAIPMFVSPDQRAMPFLPPRMSSGDRGLDLTTNAWVTDDGTNLMVSCGTRPLCIPTAIDTFGCLTTTA